ncbi:hypothetical protein Nepgr_010528 [Nepenthes gracilis]|uniref:H(+)-exporting diphosphatase n=1 Tax=Nepenthes gracilis TaxID=150966 RepID=A0AAD3SCH9_NEPGR|nr:hypothetical protein Nepgr_010528 [Nepenthes gracilis]
MGLTRLAGNKVDIDREHAYAHQPPKHSVIQRVPRQQDAQIFIDDHLFVLLIELCYERDKFGHPLFGLRANSWLNSPDIAQTTFLNHILTADHGKRIAIIENECGEVDIDGSLVAAKTALAEDLIMLNNGCLCCTVRGDLVRMISELVDKKKGQFDHIVIETIGLATPAPTIQTYYAEDRIFNDVKLDDVVTMVDSKHASFHLDDVNVNEAIEQIAHVDRIIVNKTDLTQFGKVDHGHGHHDHHHSHVHTYDPGVSSVSIVCEGNLDLDKANMRLGTLLLDRSEDIDRMKGLLSVQGMKERFGFQGGIYPKAATVGADDVDHFIRNILKDDLRNPVFIADKVGDNVRGMASNCGSYATPSSTALIVASIPTIGVCYDLTTLMYIPLANFVDRLDRFLTTLFATNFCVINAVQEIKLARVVVGLWSGLILGSVTTYYHSNGDSPKQDVADACPPRVAMNVTFSLALSYTPDFISSYATPVSFTSATMYSLAVALPSLLDAISIGLAMGPTTT